MNPKIKEELLKMSMAMRKASGEKIPPPRANDDGGGTQPYADEGKSGDAPPDSLTDPFAKAGVSFKFDPERFGKLVATIGKVVQILANDGYTKFKDLATAIFDRKPGSWPKVKPHLRNVWNVIAEKNGFEEVSKEDAEAIYVALENGEDPSPDDGGNDAPPTSTIASSSNAGKTERPEPSANIGRISVYPVRTYIRNRSTDEHCKAYHALAKLKANLFRQDFYEHSLPPMLRAGI